MAAVTVELIKQLRDRTGAGLMDCKGALLANDGDLDKAADWLREKGLAKAAKKASRIAAEGLALAKTCTKCACGSVVVLEINCETDFVAKGDAFHALVDEVADLLLEHKPTTLEAAKELTAGLFTDATVKIGEKLDLRRFEIVKKPENGSVVTYIHMGGKIAVAVALSGDNPELGKGLAMHIAANNPTYLSKSDIDPEAFAHEKTVQMEAAKNDPKLSGKPAAMLENIITNKVNKFFAESVLLAQPFLLDDSKTVEQALAAAHLNVLGFVRYQVGEGIEKRKDDFASEVMSQIG